MSTETTIRLIEAYYEKAIPTGFLSGMFKTSSKGIHNSDKVELDVLRSDAAIAVPLAVSDSTPRKYKASQFTNKGFTPPVFDLETSLSAYATGRRAGTDPFTDPSFLADAMGEAFNHMYEIEGMIRRAIELQASQVLQGGVISHTDADGNEVYGEDFALKSAHFVTVAADWALDGSTGAPLADLEALAALIRTNGKVSPDQLICGSGALQRLLSNADVKERFRKDGMDLGSLAPANRPEGATFYGWIWVGAYRMEIWCYDETYISPASGLHVPYVETNTVIMRASRARMDLTYGALPMFVPPDARVAQFLPSRLTAPGNAMDLSTNAYVDPSGKNLKVSAGTRPLCIPTHGDSFGTLLVVAP